MLEGKISVILPAYNESTHIERNLLETVSTLSEIGYDYEVIVVDDGSVDNTYLQALKVRSQHPELVRVVRYDHNRGKGNALMVGAYCSTGDYIVFLDADMDLHPEQLPLFFELMDLQEADVVIGSKRHPLSRVNYPKNRQVLSAGYYAMVRLLFGLPVRDTQTGLKVFRSRVLREVFPRVVVKRFAFDIELLANAHRLNFKIVEAPVTLQFQRSFGRIRMSDVWKIFLDTVGIFYRMHFLKYYDSAHLSRQDIVPDEYSREWITDNASVALAELRSKYGLELTNKTAS